MLIDGGKIQATKRRHKNQGREGKFTKCFFIKLIKLNADL